MIKHLIAVVLLTTFSMNTFGAVSEGVAYEKELGVLLDSVQSAPINESLLMAEDLLKVYPNSQVLQLVKADLLKAKWSVVDKIGASPLSEKTKPVAQLEGLNQEIKLRWRQAIEQTPADRGLVPQEILQLDKAHKYIIYADAVDSRVYLFENSALGLKLVHHFYSSFARLGTRKQVEGDEKTPMGVYRITQFLSDRSLPELYGSGALPIDYPNEIDIRRGRTGYGIWLHGVYPESINRIPLATRGCIALNNEDFELLNQYITGNNKSIVILSDAPDWAKPNRNEKDRNEFKAAFSNWKDDWQTQKIKPYLNHYSQKEFNTGTKSYNAWSAQKQRTFNIQNTPKIEITSLDIIRYPSEKNLIVAEFEQHYLSSTHESRLRKRQYWRKHEDGTWRIIYENKIS